MTRREPKVGAFALRFTVYAFALASVATVPYLEIGHEVGGLLYTEFGALEQFGIALLGATALAYAVAGWRWSHHRPLVWSLALITLCAITRELDLHFDEIMDGLWQLVVLALLIILLAYAYPRRGALLSQARTALDSAAFGLLAAGSLIAVAFSRMFGRAALWTQALGEHYHRTAKNLAEEGVETAGYALILVGTIELLILLRLSPRSATDESADQHPAQATGQTESRC